MKPQRITTGLKFRAESIWINRNFRAVLFGFAIYIFLLSIKVMGAGFKGLGHGFSAGLLETVDNPISGLFVGILATSIVQSSSSTTSITVALVGSGVLPISEAIPIVMGANIGTSVTNTLVSLGSIRRAAEFEKAFAGAVVHDMFNIMAATILFSVEMFTRWFFGEGMLQYLSSRLSGQLYGVTGTALSKPLDYILKPPEELIMNSMPAWAAILLGLSMLFIALKVITDSMHLIMDTKIQVILDRYLFRTALASFVFGLILTAIIQSSSVTTSIMVPLVGGGILNIEQIFPYTLGANVGTTVTAILAALATNSESALTVALAHLLFNIIGIMIIYPMKRVPIGLAKRMGKIAVEHRDAAILYIVVAFYIIPALFVFGPRLL